MPRWLGEDAAASVSWLGPVLGALVMLNVSACAFSPGDPWGHLELEVRVHFEADPEHRTDDGWLDVGDDYALDLTELGVSIDGVTVSLGEGDAASGAAEAADDDGHCHDAACEEDAVEEPIDPGSVSVAGAGEVVLEVGDDVAVEMGACPSDCALPAGALDHVEVAVHELLASGVVHDLRSGDDRRLPPGGLPFDAEWDVESHLEAALSGVVGDGSPDVVEVELHLSESLFEGVDWAALVDDDGALDASLAEAVVADNLTTHGELSTEVSWHDGP